MTPEQQQETLSPAISLEQSLMLRQISLKAEQEGCSKEFVDLLVETITYYQKKENWCLEQLKKGWGL